MGPVRQEWMLARIGWASPWMGRLGMADSALGMTEPGKGVAARAKEDEGEEPIFELV